MVSRAADPVWKDCRLCRAPHRFWWGSVWLCLQEETCGHKPLRLETIENYKEIFHWHSYSYICAWSFEPEHNDKKWNVELPNFAIKNR